MKNRDDRQSVADHEAAKHEGDVLGISDAGTATIPFKGNRGRTHPQGIDVIDPATGIGDVPQRPGAAGADFGGHEGADFTPDAAEDVDVDKPGR
jgi:hypothetical protein